MTGLPAVYAPCANRRNHGARLSPQLTDDLAGRQLAGQRVRLACPEVEGVRIPMTASGRPQRARGVVDLGICGRSGGRVLIEEPVHKPARRTAGECARETGWDRLAEQLALRLRRSGLGSQHQRRPNLSGACPGAQDGRNARAVGDPAGGHELHLDRV